MSAAWTDDEIRAATPFPKPEGALDRFWDHAGGGTDGDVEPEPLTPERRLLEHVLENGDYLKTEGSELCPAGTRLVIPLTWALIDMLEQFESERADLEGDHDREPEIEEQDSGDDEPDVDDEENGDDEPNTGDDEASAGGTAWAPGWPPGKTIAPQAPAPDPRAQGMLPVYASEESDWPRSRPKIPAEPITHSVLGTYRRLYTPSRRMP